MGGDDRVETTGSAGEEWRALQAELGALRERNRILESLVEVIDDAVFAKDSSGRYFLVNTAGARFLGKSVDEVVGRNDYELFSAETARAILEDDRNMLAEGTSRTFEQAATVGEMTRAYLVTKGPCRDARGHSVGVIGIVRDITERKHDRQQLLEAQEFLTRLLDHTPAQVYVTTRDGRVRLVNRTWERLFGIARESVLGRPVDELFPPELASRFLQQNREVVAKAEQVEFDEEVWTADCRYLLHTIKFPLRNPANEIEAVGGISFDVTEHRRAEASLEESRRRLQALFDNTLDAIWLLDDDRRFVEANPAAWALLGYSRDEYLQMKVEDVAAEKDRETVQELWRRLLASGKLAGEFEPVRKDGSTRVVDYRAVANILPGLHLLVNRDITENQRAQQELRASEEQVRLLLDSTAEAIYGVDLDGRCTFCNAATLRLLGYTDPRQLLGQSMHYLVHHTRSDGSPYPREACNIAQAVRKGQETHVADEIMWRADGTSFPAEYWSYPVHREGRLVGGVVTFFDITERKRVEEELRTLNAALENAVEGIARLDTEGRYVSANRAYAGMLGFRPEEMVGMDWQRAVHPRDLGKLEATRQRMLREDRAEAEVQAVRKDGSVFWKQTVMVKDRNPSGEWTGHYCFMRDISDRKRAEQALHAYAERLQVLSRRVVEVQEEERRHLARELHDEVGQTLTAIGINLQSIKRNCEASMLAQLDECIGIVGQVIQQVRHLSLDLRPSMLDDLGLVSALRWYLDRQAQRVGYSVRFVADPEDVVLEPSIAIAAFRVAQEALTNVARHAQATRVWVKLRLRNGVLRLVVRDDGTGFDPGSTLRRVTSGEGLGLLGMRERAGLLGGKVGIRSAPGRGAEVRLVVPLKRPEEST